MQVRHIGYRIRGFYRVAKIGHRWPMNPHAFKNLRGAGADEKHGNHHRQRYYQSGSHQV